MEEFIKIEVKNWKELSCKRALSDTEYDNYCYPYNLIRIYEILKGNELISSFINYMQSPSKNLKIEIEAWEELSKKRALTIEEENLMANALKKYIIKEVESWRMLFKRRELTDAEDDDYCQAHFFIEIYGIPQDYDDISDFMSYMDDILADSDSTADIEDSQQASRSNEQLQSLNNSANQDEDSEEEEKKSKSLRGLRN